MAVRSAEEPEEYGHRSTVQRGAMSQAGGDPHRLLGRYEIPGIRRFYMREALERVLDLVQIIVVPPRDQIRAVIEIRPRPHPGPGAHVDEAHIGFGRCERGFGRTRRDGHGVDM